MLSESPKRIITNRQLNFTLSPVDNHNSKTMPHKLNDYEIDGSWNHHHSIILDIIFDRAFHGYYKRFDKLPQSWRSNKVIELVGGFSKDSINVKSISILSLSPYDAYEKSVGWDLSGYLQKSFKDDVEVKRTELIWEEYVIRYLENSREFKDFVKEMQNATAGLFDDLEVKLNIAGLFETYPTIRRYKYDLMTHLKHIEKTKFKLNYKVKYFAQKPLYDDHKKMIDKGKLGEVYYEMKEFQSLFKVEADDELITINLNTPIGKIVLYNVLLLDTDWIPVEAFNLSKNAYFIYKRFVLNRVSGKYKAKSISLKFDDIKSFLDLRWSNDRGIHSIIVKALNDMADKGLVKNVNCEKKIGKQRIYELNFDDHKIEAAIENVEEAEVLEI
jgi:hypothetical protein